MYYLFNYTQSKAYTKIGRVMCTVAICICLHHQYSPSNITCPSPTVRRVPPRFSIPPTNHEVMPGGSVNLTCVAVGAPMPYVKWMRGEVELTKEEEMPIGRNVLELTNIRQSANYTCVAISSLGMIDTTAQITVKGKRRLKNLNMALILFK